MEKGRRARRARPSPRRRATRRIFSATLEWRESSRNPAASMVLRRFESPTWYLCLLPSFSAPGHHVHLDVVILEHLDGRLRFPRGKLKHRPGGEPVRRRRRTPRRYTDARAGIPPVEARGRREPRVRRARGRRRRLLPRRARARARRGGRRARFRRVRMIGAPSRRRAILLLTIGGGHAHAEHAGVVFGATGKRHFGGLVRFDGVLVAVVLVRRAAARSSLPRGFDSAVLVRVGGARRVRKTRDRRVPTRPRRRTGAVRSWGRVRPRGLEARDDVRTLREIAGRVDVSRKAEHGSARLTEIAGVVDDETAHGEVIRAISEGLLDLFRRRLGAEEREGEQCGGGYHRPDAHLVHEDERSVHTYTISVDLRWVMMHPGGGWFTTFSHPRRTRA